MSGAQPSRGCNPLPVAQNLCVLHLGFLIDSFSFRYSMYHHIRANYFCAILVKKSPHAEYTSMATFEYPASIMGRYLLSIRIKYHGIAFTLLTTHLESTKNAARERKQQLTKCFSEMDKSKHDSHVILAGDLNIRDNEIDSIGGLPEGVYDAWVTSGGDKNTQFTWDVGENDNLKWTFKNKPKLRFDRMLYTCGTNREMNVESFQLVGKGRLESCGRFPSDHWGILCEFTIHG